MNKENTFATNRDKLQPNNLTKRVRKKKEPEKDPPHEMSEDDFTFNKREDAMKNS